MAGASCGHAHSRDHRPRHPHRGADRRRNPAPRGLHRPSGAHRNALRPQADPGGVRRPAARNQLRGLLPDRHRVLPAAALQPRRHRAARPQKHRARALHGVRGHEPRRAAALFRRRAGGEGLAGNRLAPIWRVRDKHCHLRLFFARREVCMLFCIHRRSRMGATEKMVRGWSACALTLLLAPTPAAARERINLILDWTPSALYTPLYYAKAQGWYEKADIDLVIEVGRGSAVSSQRVGLGNSEFGLADLATAMVAKGNGGDLVAVMTIYSNPPQTFYWLKSSGIKGPADFSGKRIGNPPGDAARIMWPAFAKA